MTTSTVGWSYGDNKIINDFDPKNDKLDFQWMQASQFTVSEKNGSVYISVVNNNQSIELAGISLEDLNGTNIIALDGSAHNKWNAVFADHAVKTIVPEAMNNAEDTVTPVTMNAVINTITPANTNTPAKTIKVDWKFGAREQISDFDPKKDKIDFGWMQGKQFNVNEVNGSVFVSVVDNNHTIELVGVSIADLNYSNLITSDDSAHKKWEAVFAHTDVNTPDSSLGPDSPLLNPQVPSVIPMTDLTPSVMPMTDLTPSLKPAPKDVITNGSFEQDSVSPNTMRQGAPSGWLGKKQESSSFSNLAVIGSGGHSAPAGSQYLEMSDGCSVSQELNEVFDSNNDYELSVKVLDHGMHYPELFTLKMLAGTTEVGNADFSNVNVRDLDNTWTEFTLKVNGNEHSDLSGQKITIEMVDTQDAYDHRSGNGFGIDDVRLQKLSAAMSTFSSNGDGDNGSSANTSIQNLGVLTPSLTTNASGALPSFA